MSIKFWTATTFLTIALIAGLNPNSQAQDIRSSNLKIGSSFRPGNDPVATAPGSNSLPIYQTF